MTSEHPRGGEPAGEPGAAGATTAGSLLPASLRAALAGEPPAGGLTAVRHVVVLAQENRSFDHYFGTLRGVRGFADRNAVELPTGGTVFAQPAEDGSTVLPFPVREAVRSPRDVDTLDHTWEGGAAAWHGGRSDRWVTAKTSASLAYYDRRDLPLHHELADTFTVCDAYHASVHASTSPNRNYLWSGWTGHEADGRRAVGNDAYEEDTHPGYPWPTYLEELERAGRNWRTYTEWENFTDNQLEFFAAPKAVARKALAPARDLDGVPGAEGFTYLEAFYAAVRSTGDPAQRDRLLAALDEGVAALVPAERSLFERGLRRLPSGTLTDAFLADVASGSLPEVSYLVPPAAESEHPGESSPGAGARLIHRVLDALGSHPDVWRHTVVLVTYDENDGFFDHVPPPVPPADDPDERWRGLPTGLGMRVPMLVVSPWSVGGHVCSQVFDHTSVLRFLEAWTGVRVPNLTAWRRTVAGDLTSAFDFTSAGPRPPLEEAGAPSTCGPAPRTPADPRMPAQEPGVRPARPLPYQPDAHGSAADGAVTLTVTNSGAASAHFTLHPYAGEFAAPQHLDVRGAARWTVPLDRVAGDAYRFTVTGPNGFRREFEGPVAGGGPALVSALDHHDRDVRLTLVNTGDRPLTFVVRPLGYVDEADLADWTRRVTVKPGRSRDLVHSAADAHGWYDLEVTTDDAAAGRFRRRLMGHIENGRASVSG